MKQKYSGFLLLLTVLLFYSCHQKKAEVPPTLVSTDLKNIIKSDTLRVATMYGSTSYFLFRDELMGFDYEMVESLADYLHVNLKLSIAQTETQMAEMLQTHQVDIVAYNIIETKKLKQLFNFVLPQSESYLVLVQNIGSKALSDVTELAGKTVYVTPNSIFLSRLQSLNEEIGGTIKIVVAADSLSNDDLITMVADKKIEYTLAYHKTALLYKSYRKNLDCRMSVGFDQRNGWLIRNTNPELKHAIEKWENSEETKSFESDLFSKYWERSPYFVMKKVRIPKGAISPFDHLFKKYASQIDWDWRLLASVAFHESRFYSSTVSWAGASGLMQLMPRTAANFGLDRQTIMNPEKNIEAGVQYIKSLNLSFRRIENKDERIKFILAAYNCGPAHILDAMALANKYGKNSKIWFNQVDYFLQKESEPEFYDDPVVKYGYFSGKETVRYVRNTLDTYEKYLRRK